MIETHRHINHINNIVCQLPAVVGCEVVAAALDEKDLAVELGLKGLERAHIGANVLADCGMGAPSGLDGKNAFRGQGLVFNEELLILPREYVVCDGG